MLIRRYLGQKRKRRLGEDSKRPFLNYVSGLMVSNLIAGTGFLIGKRFGQPEMGAMIGGFYGGGVYGGIGCYDIFWDKINLNDKQRQKRKNDEGLAKLIK